MGFLLQDNNSGGYGKIKDCMFNSDTNEKILPPRPIPSLVEGFNTIAGQIYIIIFPVVLDLLLWFGPLVRVKNLLLPILERTAELSASAYGEQGTEIMESAGEMWAVLLDGFNMLFGLRTYPIGVPSLMIGLAAQHNPLGSLRVIEVSSPDSAVLLVVAFSIAGLLLGSLYYAIVAHAVGGKKERLTFSALSQFTGQSFLLSLLVIAAVVMLGFPAMCLISALILVFPALGLLPFMILGLMMVWVLLPLAFTPHGIFMNSLKVGRSMVSSVKMVRSTMSGAGVFFIMIIMLSYGLDALWSTPDVESWMLVVGILGHGFITSGLLAATFVYYRDGSEWLEELIRLNQAPVDTAKL